MWVVIRAANEQDYEALNKSARRFIDRHPEIKKMVQSELATTGDSLEMVTKGLWAALDSAIRMVVDMDIPEGKRLAILWKRCIRRALDAPDADGIAWGNVGYHQD